MISLRVPATTANLGPGFDSFGLALKLYNRFEFTPAQTDRLHILPGTCVEVSDLPLDPRENLVFQAMDRYFTLLGEKRPSLDVGLEVHIPLARGLGSSSTAIAAGVVAANRLNHDALDLSALISIATEIEGHPDNVAPAISGGCMLCDEGRAYPLPWPEDWQILIALPDYPMRTDNARKALPESYPLHDAIYNLRKASVLTYSLLRHDEDAFRQSLYDALHQPFRGPLITEFEPVRQIAIQKGAFGGVISGAGSAIAIFFPDAVRPGLLDELNRYKQEEAPALRLIPLAVDYQGTHDY